MNSCLGKKNAFKELGRQCRLQSQYSEAVAGESRFPCYTVWDTLYKSKTKVIHLKAIVCVFCCWFCCCLRKAEVSLNYWGVSERLKTYTNTKALGKCWLDKQFVPKLPSVLALFNSCCNHSDGNGKSIHSVNDLHTGATCKYWKRGPEHRSLHFPHSVLNSVLTCNQYHTAYCLVTWYSCLNTK